MSKNNVLKLKQLLNKQEKILTYEPDILNEINDLLNNLEEKIILPVLTEELVNNRYIVRFRALYGLTQINPKSSKFIELIAKFLHDDKFKVQKQAVMFLLNNQSNEALAILLDYLEVSQNLHLSIQIVSQLKKKNITRALPVIKSILSKRIVEEPKYTSNINSNEIYYTELLMATKIKFKDKESYRGIVDLVLNNYNHAYDMILIREMGFYAYPYLKEFYSKSSIEIQRCIINLYGYMAVKIYPVKVFDPLEEFEISEKEKIILVNDLVNKLKKPNNKELYHDIIYSLGEFEQYAIHTQNLLINYYKKVDEKLDEKIIRAVKNINPKIKIIELIEPILIENSNLEQISREISINNYQREKFIEFNIFDKLTAVSYISKTNRDLALHILDDLLIIDNIDFYIEDNQLFNELCNVIQIFDTITPVLMRKFETILELLDDTEKAKFDKTDLDLKF